MPLSDMYRTMLEASNPATWEANRQKQLMGEYELESKRRAMADEQRLRDLYSSGTQPSIEQITAANPEFGLKMQQFMQDQMLKNAQLQEIKGKIDLQAADQAAAAAFPAYVKYQENISRGMPEQQALQIFHAENGTAVSNAAKSGASWVQSGSSYDPKKVSPEDVRALNARFGRFTPMDQNMQKAEQERILRSIPPQMSPQQYYGEQHTTPEGYVTRTPGMGGQPSTRQAPAQMPSQPSMGQEDVTEQQLMSYIDSLPEGPEKQRLQAVITQGKSMAPGSTSAVEISPEELANIRKFRKAEEAKAVETAKLEAGKEQTVKQREEILSSIPSRDEVESLIDKSISSGVEQQLKGKIGPVVGMGSEALTATKQLDVIAPQLKSITKTLAGAGAISDFEQKMMADAAGAIADPNVPADARKAAFRTFMDIMDKADKSAKPTQGGLPKPKTTAEARALPKGTQFIDPNGIVRINE